MRGDNDMDEQLMVRKEGTYRKFIVEAITQIENASKEKDPKAKVVLYCVIAVLFVLGLFALAVWNIMTFCAVFGLLAVGCILLFVFGDRIVMNRFFRIRNAHERFNIIEADEDTIRELYKDSALTYAAGPDDELLDFIYNWLAYEKVLKDEKLDLYKFDGKTLKSALNKKRINDKATFMCIFNRDLETNEDYFKHHLYAGARWLDDMC